MSQKRPDKQAIFTPKVAVTPVKTRAISTSLLLGGLAASAAVILTGWVLFFQSDENITIDLNNVQTTEDGRLELSGLTYQGKTKKGEPFTLRAEQASEDPNNAEQVNLSTIDGEVMSMRNGQILLSAKRGQMNQTDNEIYLEGQVEIIQTVRQLQLETEQLYANLDTGALNAPQFVTITSPDSALSGASMQVTNFGETVLFKGKSKAVIGDETNE